MSTVSTLKNILPPKKESTRMETGFHANAFDHQINFKNNDIKPIFANESQKEQ